jgi:hypothetical protein
MKREPYKSKRKFIMQMAPKDSEWPQWIIYMYIYENFKQNMKDWS